MTMKRKKLKDTAGGGKSGFSEDISSHSEEKMRWRHAGMQFLVSGCIEKPSLIYRSKIL